jgi:hypothetical protein
MGRKRAKKGHTQLAARQRVQLAADARKPHFNEPRFKGLPRRIALASSAGSTDLENLCMYMIIDACGTFLT